MQDVESQVTVSSDYKQIHGTENSLAVAVTFAASTSVLPSARVALPTVRKQSLRQKKRANEIARVKRHKVFIRARTLILHLLSAHGSTKSLFHGTLGGLEVAGDPATDKDMRCVPRQQDHRKAREILATDLAWLALCHFESLV